MPLFPLRRFSFLFFPLYHVFTWKIMSGSSKSLSLFLSELLVSTDVHACRRANDTRPKHANKRHWQKYLRDFRVRLAASSLFPIGKSSHVLPLRFSRAPYATHRFYGCISYDSYDDFSNLRRTCLLYRWIIRQSVWVCVILNDVEFESLGSPWNFMTSLQRSIEAGSL